MQKKMIDYKKIRSRHFGDDLGMNKAMREAVKEAIPLILQDASKKAECYWGYKKDSDGNTVAAMVVSKGSITSIVDELIEKYTK